MAGVQRTSARLNTRNTDHVALYGNNYDGGKIKDVLIKYWQLIPNGFALMSKWAELKTGLPELQELLKEVNASKPPSIGDIDGRDFIGSTRFERKKFEKSVTIAMIIAYIHTVNHDIKGVQLFKTVLQQLNNKLEVYKNIYDTLPNPKNRHCMAAWIDSIKISKCQCHNNIAEYHRISLEEVSNSLDGIKKHLKLALEHYASSNAVFASRIPQAGMNTDLVKWQLAYNYHKRYHDMLMNLNHDFQAAAQNEEMQQRIALPWTTDGKIQNDSNSGSTSSSTATTATTTTTTTTTTNANGASSSSPISNKRKRKTQQNKNANTAISIKKKKKKKNIKKKKKKKKDLVARQG